MRDGGSSITQFVAGWELWFWFRFSSCVIRALSANKRNASVALSRDGFGK
jgi:hypothetical protein